jgi:hypothetical protein
MTSAHPWLIAACALNIGALSSTAYVALQYTDVNARMAALAQSGDAAGASSVKPGDERNVVEVSSLLQKLDLLKTEMRAAQRKFDDWATKAKQQQSALEEALRTIQLKAEARNTVASQDRILTADELEYQARRQTEEYAAKARDHFQADPIDLKWSSQMTGIIEEKFNNPELKQATLLDTECRATLCRLSVEHTNAQRQADFENQLPMLFAAELPHTTMFQEELANGSVRTTVYLAREGHNLR